MSKRPASRMYTLVAREFQEYRNSLLITPIAIAVTLTLVMLSSVLLADRISFMGEVVMDTLVAESNKQVQVTIQMGDDGATTHREFHISTQEEPMDEEEWNFSREWEFDPPGKPDTAGQKEEDEDTVGSLNPMLNVLHSFMILVLLAVTINYLLGCLYNDRKDRSILFWKSMPVSDTEAGCSRSCWSPSWRRPLIYIVASWLYPAHDHRLIDAAGVAPGHGPE